MYRASTHPVAARTRRAAPGRRTVGVVGTRITGCQPSPLMVCHRVWLHSPRSHRTYTGWVRGPAGANRRSRHWQWARQAGDSWAPTTAQATGMA